MSRIDDETRGDLRIGPADPTPPLAEFMAHYEADDNVWWSLACGHHQNLFDAAIEELIASRNVAKEAYAKVCELDEANRIYAGLSVADRAEIAQLRATDAAVRAVLAQARAISPGAGMSVYVADLERALGADVVKPHKLGQNEPSTEPRYCMTLGHEQIPASVVGTLDDGAEHYTDVAYCVACAASMVDERVFGPEFGQRDA
jgi:hypothetical protein